MPATPPESRVGRRGGRRRGRWTVFAWLLGLPVLPALLLGWLHPRAPDWAGLSAGVARLSMEQSARLEAPLWVDARRDDHFQNGHIPGAINLGEDDWNAQLPAFLDQWEPGRAVVVYCDGEDCLASRHVAMRLRRELQIDNVSILTGGWPAWQAGQNRLAGQGGRP